MVNNTELVTIRIRTEYANIIRLQANLINSNPTTFMRSILENYAKSNSTNPTHQTTDPELILTSLCQINFLYNTHLEELSKNNKELLESVLNKQEQWLAASKKISS